VAPGTAARRAGDARYPAVTPKAPCAKIPSVIAKTVSQVHAVDADGGTVIRKHLRRAEVLSFLAGLEPCLIGMEACATSHWARELAKFGHTVKLMPPAYVKPYGAPRRRVVTSGGRFHPESCRLIWKLTSGLDEQSDGPEPRDKGRLGRLSDPAGSNVSEA
jgi:transposase